MFVFIENLAELSSSMADTLAPTENCLKRHIAVHLKDCVLFLSKSFCTVEISEQCTRIDSLQGAHYHIWIFNLWTEQWRKYAIPEQEKLPEVVGRTGIVIGSDCYFFGGTNTLLRKLRSKNGTFVWSIIYIEYQTNVPSPRLYHCAWEHGEKMWVFAGYGPSPHNYLNDHGDFRSWDSSLSFGENSQLLSYDPSTKIWVSVKCSGEVPSPRNQACTGIIGDNVWLYGGSTTVNDIYRDDLYKLNMYSFVWTKIESTVPRPSGRRNASLTPVSANQLVLYGGRQENMSDQDVTIPWVFDVQSHIWRQHPITENHRWNHTQARSQGGGQGGHLTPPKMAKFNAIAR